MLITCCNFSNIQTATKYAAYYTLYVAKVNAFPGFLTFVPNPNESGGNKHLGDLTVMLQRAAGSEKKVLNYRSWLKPPFITSFEILKEVVLRGNILEF